MLREKHYFYVLAVAPSQYISYLQLSLSLSLSLKSKNLCNKPKTLTTQRRKIKGLHNILKAFKALRYI